MEKTTEAPKHQDQSITNRATAEDYIIYIRHRQLLGERVYQRRKTTLRGTALVESFKSKIDRRSTHGGEFITIPWCHGQLSSSCKCRF